MVVALGPGKFYGSSLPRPRIYTDMKFSSERVDPPVPVMDPLLSWAHEAHWSMGGLSFLRHRLQGRIEGNISRLRSQQERAFKNKAKSHTPPHDAPLAVKRKSSKRRIIDEVEDEDEDVEEEEALECRRRTVRKVKGDSKRKEAKSPSPPDAPLAVKRKRRIIDEDEDEDEVEVLECRRRTARKLKDEFDEVAEAIDEGLRRPEKRITRRSPVKAIELRKGEKEVTRRSPVKAFEEGMREGEKRITRQSPVKAIDEGSRGVREGEKEEGVVERVNRGGLIGKRLIKGLKGISGSRMFN